jgi:hypothetical protein
MGSRVKGCQPDRIGQAQTLALADRAMSGADVITSRHNRRNGGTSFTPNPSEHAWLSFPAV